MIATPNERKKKLLIVAPSLAVGGIERALVVLAEEFVKKNIDVYFLPCLPTPPFFKLSGKIILVKHDLKLFSGAAKKALFYLKLMKFIRNKANEIEPDAILCYGDIFNPLVLLSLYKTPHRVFISDRTSPDYSHAFPIPLLKSKLYPNAAGFIAQTGRAFKYKDDQFKGRLNMRIVPNAIRSFEHAIGERKQVVLYVGRFAWEKAPLRLIEAFAKSENNRIWELHMAGSGPQLDEAKALANQLKINKRVKFLGRVEDVNSLYAQAGIFVLPSVLEGFPNALCEAMSAGLPCICFDSIPYEDILVPGESGEVVGNGDVDGLAAKIDFLIKNPERREMLGNAAKKQMESLKSEVIAEKILNFIFP